MTRVTLFAALIALTLAASDSHAESALTSEISRNQLATLDQARGVFERYLAAWSGQKSTGEDVAAVFSDNAQIELALPGRLEWAINIEGRPAIGEFLDVMYQAGTHWTFTELHYFPTLQAGVVFVQYAGNATSATTGTVQYRNLLLMEIDNERIVRIRDFNSARFVMHDLNTLAKRAAERMDGTSAPGQ